MRSAGRRHRAVRPGDLVTSVAVAAEADDVGVGVVRVDVAVVVAAVAPFFTTHRKYKHVYQVRVTLQQQQLAASG